VATAIGKRPSFVASRTSRVDGASEGGRLSTGSLPETLVLYGVPLAQFLRSLGYQGKLSVEPALVSGNWVLKVTYEGARPPSAPERWHGHRVVLEEAKAADA
jgi:hypothetical protein